MGKRIYKVLRSSEWSQAQQAGAFAGAPVDLADGYIHLSEARQLAGTLGKHFRGQPGLVLVAFDADSFGEELKWEPSRGGDLFPQLNAELPIRLAVAVWDLELDAGGIHRLPELPNA